MRPFVWTFALSAAIAAPAYGELSAEELAKLV